jgi:hypothetical protein
MAVFNNFSYLILPTTVFGVVREKSLQKWVSIKFELGSSAKMCSYIPLLVEE